MNTVKCVFWIILSAYLLTADTLTLSQIQNLLFEKNCDVLIEKKNVAIAEGNLKITKTSLQPMVSFYSSFGLTSVIPEMTLDLSSINPMFPVINKELGSHDKTEFGLDIAYPFFTGMARKNSINAAKIQIDAADKSTLALKNSLSFTLGMLYLGWEMNDATVTVREGLVKQLQEYLVQSENLLSSGVSTKTRVLEAQSSLAMAQVQYTVALNRADSLKLEIASLILTEANVLVLKRGALFNDPRCVDSVLVLTSKTDRPEISYLDKNKEQLEFTKKALYGQRFPSLAGMAGYRVGKPGLNMGSEEFMNYFLVGLRLDWNIYDGLKNKTQRNQLTYSQQTLDLRKQAFLNYCDKLLDNAKMTIKQAQQEIVAVQKSIDLAAAVVEDCKNRIAAGTATSLEYLTAINNQALAKMNKEIAVFKLKAGCLSYIFATGNEIVF